MRPAAARSASSTVRARPPGACSAAVRSRAWTRTWGARALVTLVQPFELKLLGAEHIGARAAAHGLRWYHLPVVDGAAPGSTFEEAWREVGPALHALLDDDRRVVLHCRAGIGRTGTVAARLLIERGMPPGKAIVQVRRARPGAIESPEQASWVRACRRA